MCALLQNETLLQAIFWLATKKIPLFVDVTVTLVLALPPDGEDSVILPIATTFEEYLLFAMLMKLFAGIMSFNLPSNIKL